MLFWEEGDPLRVAPQLNTNFRSGAMIQSDNVILWKSTDLLPDSKLGRMRYEPWEIPARSALPSLVDALGSSDARVRIETVQALGRMGPAASPVVSRLIQVLKQESDVNIRRVTIETLGKIGPAAADALPIIQAISRESSYNQCACWAYDHVSPGSVRPLV
jgi:hypothetical protein